MEQAALSAPASGIVGTGNLALAPPPAFLDEPPEPCAGAPAARTLPDIERETIVRAMQRAAGNVSRAARDLGISRDTLRYRLAKHGLDAGAGRDGE